MFILKLIAATIITAGVLYALVKVHKEINGETPAPSNSKDRENGRRTDELEAFIAAYRRDKEAGFDTTVLCDAQGFVTEQGALSTVGNRYSMDGFYAARLRKVL
jgi:hypothetical protein